MREVFTIGYGGRGNDNFLALLNEITQPTGVCRLSTSAAIRFNGQGSGHESLSPTGHIRSSRS